MERLATDINDDIDMIGPHVKDMIEDVVQSVRRFKRLRGRVKRLRFISTKYLNLLGILLT